MPASLLTLNSRELSRLVRLEEIIDRGQRTFLEVGRALCEIRDNRLYREHHATFDEYCRERWGWNRAHAYRMIDSARVVEALTSSMSPNGDSAAELPRNESQARPLTRLKTEQLANAWQDAVDLAAEREEPITARIVEEVVERYEQDSQPYQDVADAMDEEEEIIEARPIDPFNYWLDVVLNARKSRRGESVEHIVEALKQVIVALQAQDSLPRRQRDTGPF